VQTITAWVRLTPGELDTAAKAAAGRTNKAVVGREQAHRRVDRDLTSVEVTTPRDDAEGALESIPTRTPLGA
jgi:hypothetical protein